MRDLNATPSKKARQRGFTLTEMMVALVLGAIIVAPFYVITRGMSEETTHQQMETEAMQRSRVGIELLTADFQRVGMLVSPNPAVDVDSIVSSNTAGNTQSAWNRQAVVHLNRDGSDDFDSIILVGSFVSSNTYTGYINTAGADTVSINQQFAQADDCTDEFNPAYSFVHLYTSTGQTLDAKVSSVTTSCAGAGGTDCLCTVSVEPGELFVDGPAGFTEGQLVNVAANQAALYRVEPVTEPDGGTHNALIRYFMNYSNSQNLGASCSLSDIDDSMIADFATTPVQTAKIIAEYVEEFEVWFRPVVRSNFDDTTEPPRPVFHQTDTVVGGSIGFAPPADVHLIGIGDPAAYTSNIQDLSCAFVSGRVGPEYLRSAMVRLAVRTEQTDMSLRITDLNEPDPEAVWATVDGVTRYNVARGPAGDVGAYKLRTVITEVAMPNLASKAASFPALSSWGS